jgi:hypothetical protein
MSRILAAAAVSLVVVGILGAATELTDLIGPYLGQSPPGISPRLFAYGIVSVRENFEHSAAVFSPDGLELFWCSVLDFYDKEPAERLQQLFYMKQSDGVWTEPEAAPFAINFLQDVYRPVFSPDGQRLFFETGSRPYTGGESDADIYVVKREDGAWSDPVPLPPWINTSAIERLHFIAADGSIVFARNALTSREEMLIARWVEGEFTEPEPLGAPFDSDARELAIAMAPDESYMLIALTRTGREDELYISYREPAGGWSERVRTPFLCGGFLAISPDGAYLFFLSHHGIMWMDTSFVENLKPSYLR